MKSCIKKSISVVVAVAIMATALVGCGLNNQVNDSLSILITKYSPIQEEMLAEYQKLYPNVKVNIIKKPEDITYDEFYKKMSTELMAGKGPDVISLDNDIWSTLDGDKAMQGGLFEDLSPYIEQDGNFDRELYYDFVLDSGKLYGKQYVIPVYFSVPMIIAGNKTTEGYINIDKLDTYKNLKNEINMFYSENKSEKSLLNRCNLNEDLLFYSGIELVDYNSQEILVDATNLKDIADFMKILYRNNNGDVPRYIFNNTAILEYYDDLNSIIGNQMLITKQSTKPFAIKSKQETTIAKVSSAVAVNSSSKNKENAYEFIKVILSSLESKNLYYSNYNAARSNVISKSGMKSIYESFVTSNATKGIITIDGVPHEYDIIQPTEEDINLYNSIIEEITTCKLFESKAYDILYDELLPYLKDEKSYEECIQSAQSKLEIYISE